jgi:hypothetical protein
MLPLPIDEGQSKGLYNPKIGGFRCKVGMSMAKIMVVDDDNDVRIVASRGLRQAGHEVI